MTRPLHTSCSNAKGVGRHKDPRIPTAHSEQRPDAFYLPLEPISVDHLVPFTKGIRVV